MMNNKLFSFISLAQKAGKIASGEDTCIREIKSGKARLVIVAVDSSDNTKKMFKDMCSYRGIPYLEHGTKDMLGSAIGKEYRAVIAIKDDGFADGIIRLYNQTNSGGD